MLQWVPAFLQSPRFSFAGIVYDDGFGYLNRMSDSVFGRKVEFLGQAFDFPSTYKVDDVLVLEFYFTGWLYGCLA